MRKLMSLLLAFTLILAPVATAQTASEEFQTDEEGKKSMANTLLVMTNSAFGASLLVGCVGGGTFSPSNTAFAAGSIVYLLGEITAGKDKSDALKKKSENLELDREKMQGRGIQRTALVLALEEQEDMLKFVSKRKAWLTAVNVAYLAAAGFAIIEAIPPGAVLFSVACPQLLPMSNPWMLAIVGAYATLLAASSGETLAALLGPVFLATSVYFIPGVATPVGRAILFSAAAAVALNAASDLTSKEDVIKGNIEKLNSALQQFEKENGIEDSIAIADAPQTGGAEGSGGSSNLSSTESSSGLEVGSLASGQPSEASALDQSVSLANANGNGNAAVRDRNSVVCASTSPGGNSINVGSNCSRPILLSSTKFPGDVQALQIAGQTAVRMSNDMASGNTGAAEISAASVSAMAARVKAGNEEALKKLNTKLVQEGKKPLDLEGETKKLLGRMNSTMNQSIAKGGAPLLASLGYVGVKKTEVTSEVAPRMNPKSLSVVSSVVSESAKTSLAISPSEEPPSAPIAQLETDVALRDFEVNMGDVSRDQTQTIWNQVSRRYIKSYDKILERKKLSPED